MHGKFLYVILLAAVLGSVGVAGAAKRNKDSGRATEIFTKGVNLKKEGEFEKAVSEFQKVTNMYPESDLADDALFNMGECFEKLSETYSKDAWGWSSEKLKRDKPEKMEVGRGERLWDLRVYIDKYVTDLNRKYRAEVFSHPPLRLSIVYTNYHYRTLLEEYPDSEFSDRAELKVIQGELVGPASEVFTKVEGWLQKYPESDLRPEAWLLLARVYEDAWSWENYRYSVSGGASGDKTVAESYRGKGLRTYKFIINAYPGSEYSKIAEEEYKRLFRREKDSITYGIMFE